MNIINRLTEFAIFVARQVKSILNRIGNLEDLTTTDKSSIVNAINEVNREVSTGNFFYLEQSFNNQSVININHNVGSTNYFEKIVNEDGIRLYTCVETIDENSIVIKFPVTVSGKIMLIFHKNP